MTGSSGDVSRPGRWLRSDRRKRVPRLLLALLTIVAMVGATTPASGDDISNNLDGTVDADAEALNLVAGGSTGTVGLSVVVVIVLSEIWLPALIRPSQS